MSASDEAMDEFEAALEADKLRGLTGEDHGPFCAHCLGSGIEDVDQVECSMCGGTGKPLEADDWRAPW